MTGKSGERASCCCGDTFRFAPVSLRPTWQREPSLTHPLGFARRLCLLLPTRRVQIFESLENVTADPRLCYCGHAIDPTHGDRQVRRIVFFFFIFPRATTTPLLPSLARGGPVRETPPSPLLVLVTSHLPSLPPPKRTVFGLI